jgi:hypothetical protein
MAEPAPSSEAPARLDAQTLTALGLALLDAVRGRVWMATTLCQAVVGRPQVAALAPAETLGLLIEARDIGDNPQGAALAARAILALGVDPLESDALARSTPGDMDPESAEPLGAAAGAGNAEALAALLEGVAARGVGPRDARFLAAKRSALRRAAKAGSEECVEMIADSLDESEPEDAKALDEALLDAARHARASCVLALAQRARLSATDGDGRDALFYVVRESDAAAFDLLARREDFQESVRRSHQLLRIAVAQGSEAMLDRLLPFCDASATDRRGRTLLMLAVESGFAAGARKLMGLSNEIAIDDSGDDAFEIALVRKRWECLDLFARAIGEPRLREALRVAPPGSLPAIHSRLERGEIASALVEAGERAGEEAGAPPKGSARGSEACGAGAAQESGVADARKRGGMRI